MGRRKLATNYSLFLEKDEPIPRQHGEKCYGCGEIIDMRRGGWGVTHNQKFYHPGEECWRKVMARELERH